MRKKTGKAVQVSSQRKCGFKNSGVHASFDDEDVEDDENVEIEEDLQQDEEIEELKN